MSLRGTLKALLICVDVVWFVTRLEEKFQKFVGALFKIAIGEADTANS